MRRFLNNFNKKSLKYKIFYIFFVLTFIQVIINIVSLLKDNFTILAIVIGIIIIVNMIKRN